MKTHFSSFFSNSNYQLLHSRPFSLLVFLPFWCYLLFQWYIAAIAINMWFPFPILLSTYSEYLETRTIGFDRNQKLLMMDLVKKLINKWRWYFDKSTLTHVMYREHCHNGNFALSGGRGNFWVPELRTGIPDGPVRNEVTFELENQNVIFNPILSKLKKIPKIGKILNCHNSGSMQDRLVIFGYNLSQTNLMPW